MTDLIDYKTAYTEMRHALLNDLQVLLSAVQLCKDDSQLVTILDRAILRIERKRRLLQVGGEEHNVCR